jgi:hypothetical protein
MKTNRFFWAMFLLLTLLAAVGCTPGDYETDADRNYEDAVQNTKRVQGEIQLENQRRLEEATNKRVYLLEGDAVGDLWGHCTYAPPKQPANQKRCKAILDRVQKDIAADDARSNAKKKAW